MSKLLPIFLGAIGGIVFLLIGIILMPLLIPQKVDQWTVAGLAATFAGVMAALLAIIGAATVAFNWLYLEQRIEKVLKAKTDDIKRELFADLRERIRAMGEFAIIWSDLSRDIVSKEKRIQEVIRRAPDLANVAALTAEEFISSILIHDYNISTSPSSNQESRDSTQKDEILAHADYWAKVALDARNSHDPGYPEYVMAQVRSLQKEPESALDFLKQAFQKDPSFKDITRTDDRIWRIFTGMTHGGSQIKKLEALFSLLGLEQPTLAEVKYHCTHRNQHHIAKFAALKKSNGDYLEVLVESVQQQEDKPYLSWCIRGDTELQQQLIHNLEMAMKVIEKFVIPTKLIPNEV